MEYQFIMGGIVAIVILGFQLLYYRSTGNKKTGASMEVGANESSQTENVMNTDIIIVGAGVAGSALAYTLGKGSLFLFPFDLALFASSMST